MKVHVIQTGVANLASVRAAFERLGCQVEATAEPSVVNEADYVVLPGVGAFQAGMEALNARNLQTSIRQRITGGQPTLAICLGLQLLAQRSDESPGIEGLGIFETSVAAYPDSVSVPQFGWNTVATGAPCLGDGGYVYFANSYRLDPFEPSGWRVSFADYGGPFCAALQQERVLACQFHPELSGKYGETILANWLEGVTQC